MAGRGDPREPFFVRLRAFFAPPTKTLHRHLVNDEHVLHQDLPALSAFFVEEVEAVVITIVVAVIAIGSVALTQDLLITGIAMIVTGATLLYLQIKRWTQRYTLYVLTNTRVMKLSGVFHRSEAWIPWLKVTDVRIEATLLGRVFGYSTVYIDSASERSGLSEMKNLRDPSGFYLRLTELVQVSQNRQAAARQAALLHE